MPCFLFAKFIRTLSVGKFDITHKVSDNIGNTRHSDQVAINSGDFDRQNCHGVQVIGALLIVACFGYLIDVVTYLLFPAFKLTVSGYTFIGEIAMLLWLLIKGVNVEKWKISAQETSLA
jgi:hypothetical protein